MPGDSQPSDDELAHTATAPGSDKATVTPAPPLGSVLGRYRLERELGAGGMGVVHAAFDPDLERRVALKVLHVSDTPEAAQRLLREARALARLSHPNVVTVHEVDSAGGRDYVAMELIDGATLAEWLKSGTHSPEDIITAFLGAGRGLAAAHAAGLIHRDFKPHNVLRRKDGRIVVTDFGLARGVDTIAALEATVRLRPSADPIENKQSSLSGLTQTGSVMGTPAYMAPEQWRGENVGPPADQFAFCVALWEALAGERPFRGTTVEALKEEVMRGPGELDDSKLPRRMRKLLLRGLDPDPKKRWPSMDTLLTAMTRAERRPGVALAIASVAVVGAAALYAAFGRDDDAPVVAPSCEPAVVELASVWSPALANELRDKTSPEIRKLVDEQVAAWTSARGAACQAPPAIKARRLACLDGVIVRLDAVRKATLQVVKPTVDFVARGLIEPSVCATDDPPRLPAKLSEAAVAGIVLSHRPDPDAKLDQQAEAAALKAAGDEPCARAFIRAASFDDEDSTKAREAVDEAAQAADACGDDRTRAEAMIVSLAYQITAFHDPKLPKLLAAAEAAVRKVAQPDLVAQLDLLRATIAGTAGKWDEQIKLADSAAEGFGDRRPRSRLSAILMKVDALQSRHKPGDLEASRAELARWRPEAERVAQPKTLLRFDAADAGAQWQLGDIAAARPRFVDIHERSERQRTKPRKEGKTLRGVVVNEQGRPAAGATVAADFAVTADSAGIGYVGGTGEFSVAKTDAQGRYTLEHVQTGSVIVAQLGNQRSRVRDAKDGDRLTLAPTSRVSGRVVDRADDQFVVVAISSDRGASPMYQMLAPIAADGTFTLEGVPLGKLRIGAVARTGAIGQTFATQEVTVGAAGLDALELRRGEGRKLGVVVRSSAAIPLAGAQVFVATGELSIKNVKDLDKLMRAPGVAVEMARPMTGETPPELGRLYAGDVVATFPSAPAGIATACALGLSGDLSDSKYWEQLEKHRDELDVRCTIIAPDTTAVTIMVPPMKRMD